MFKFFNINLIFLVLSQNALAAGGGIPVSTIIAQTVNLTLLICILTYFLKDPLKKLFTKRAEDYDFSFKEAQRLKEEALEKRDVVKTRLKNLKNNADASIIEAQDNSKKNTSKLLEETQESVNKMLSDVEDKNDQLKNRMLADMKLELLSLSFERAKDGLSTEMSEAEIVALKKEFIDKIQVVQ